MFKLNESNTDRLVRLVLGIVIAGLGIYFQSWLGLIAIIPLATAAIGWCPLYSLFGISTCAIKPQSN